MNGIIGEFRIGEDIAIALDATAGSTAGVSAITPAAVKAAAASDRLNVGLF